MDAEERTCNVCGETWTDTGDLTCPFCGSDDIEIYDPDAETWLDHYEDW